VDKTKSWQLGESEMANIYVIWDAVTVKKAVFVKMFSRADSGHPNPIEFFLQHNNTTIVRGYYNTNEEPVITNILLRGRTKSDDRAIMQALKYLKIDKTSTEIQEQIKAHRRRITLET
jgi:hypothetical protein